MKLISASFLVLFCLQIVAFENNKTTSYRIQINAILNNAAVLTINGQQQMLSINQHSKEGYKLTNITTDTATLLITGKSHTFKLGTAIGSSSASNNRAKSISINRDSNGMFLSAGQINDRPVKFLVDTGATFIAINSVLAKQLRIDYLRNGQEQFANTASGVVKAYKISLNNVSIGDLKLYQVEAVVIEGQFPVVPLLGMSFLKRVKMKNEGLLLTIEERL